MHTVKKDWSRPTLLDFNEWLEDKAEAHERMKISAAKPKNDESAPSVTRTKTGAKVLPLLLLAHLQTETNLSLTECN